MARDYYYDDEYGGARRWLKLAVIGLVTASVIGGGYWALSSDEQAQPRLLAAAPGTTETTTAVTTATTVAPESAPPLTSAVPVPSTTTTTATDSEADEPTGTVASAPPPTMPATATPTSSPELAMSMAPVQPAAGPGYPTSDDGAPLPVIVTYDTDVITVTGFVPSQAAKDRLGLLAQANSKTDARLENNLVINENVPIGVGVRVIELNSARFPEGSTEILPAHAAELERVATVMDALPNVTLVVIGHADQRGDEATNYAISAKRAVAVVNFLTFLGVSPTRMSSRAVGEADLLTLADDNTALALNRRTEFIFYGVLVD